MVQRLCDSSCHSAGVGIGKVLLPIHGKPLVLHFSSGPEVVDASFIRLPSAVFQNAGFKAIGMAPNGLDAICRSTGTVVKIVIAVVSLIVRNQPPSLH